MPVIFSSVAKSKLANALIPNIRWGYGISYCNPIPLSLWLKPAYYLTPMADAVILTEVSTLYQNLLHLKMVDLSHVQFASEMLIIKQISLKVFPVMSIVGGAFSEFNELVMFQCGLLVLLRACMIHVSKTNIMQIPVLWWTVNVLGIILCNYFLVFLCLTFILIKDKDKYFETRM